MVRRTYLVSLALAALVWASAVGVAEARTLHVHPGQSIQRAVDRAKPGDTIWLAPGVYHQNVTITTSHLTLQGSGWGRHGTRLFMAANPTPSPCTDPSGVNGICVVGQVDQQGNPGTPIWGTSVRNLSLHGFTGFGLILFNANDSTVSHVRAHGNGSYGISGFVLSGVRYLGNMADDNGEPGFYIGDSPHANATVVGNVALRNGVGGPEGMGFLFRDSSWGNVHGNTAQGNCLGMLFLDSPEDPLPATHWNAWGNRANRNNGACPGAQGGPPPLSGLGIVLFGAQSSVLANNWVFGNRASGASIFSGGIVVASSKSIGGSDPVGNLVKNNTAHGNRPFDILWDGSGSNNRFVHNSCDLSSPGSIC